MAITGRIFDISNGCVDDGPGLRTVVFLKGCRLDCPWCHNIEGKSFDPEIAFDANLCIGCKRCLEACGRPWNFTEADAWRKGCAACGKCARKCPTGARKLVGREWSVEEAVAEASRDADFFRGTGGGVTFSGGEPLAQFDFLFACARALKEKGIHVAVETSGFWPERLIDGVISNFDLLLYDLKHVNHAKFRASIGGDNRIVLSNLTRLLERGANVEIRIPLVPGFNTGDADLASMANWLGTRVRIPPIRILPFHRMAFAKQHLFSRPYPCAGLTPLSESDVKKASSRFRDFGLQRKGIE